MAVVEGGWATGPCTRVVVGTTMADVVDVNADADVDVVDANSNVKELVGRLEVEDEEV
jgi:hypothetical protein